MGEDQLPHIEITREVARRFNSQYSPDVPVFPEPEGKVTVFARLPGLNGQRMSKSMGNTILLSDRSEEVNQKLRRNDPGRPEVCLVFTYHKKFNPEEIPGIERDCRSGVLGCVACKTNCAEKLNRFLNPIREKRQYYEDHIDEVKDILTTGEKNAKEVAVATMDEVHQKMKLG